MSPRRGGVEGGRSSQPHAPKIVSRTSPRLTGHDMYERFGLGLFNNSPGGRLERSGPAWGSCASAVAGAGATGCGLHACPVWIKYNTESFVQLQHRLGTADSAESVRLRSIGKGRCVFTTAVQDVLLVVVAMRQHIDAHFMKCVPPYQSSSAE